MSYGHLIFQMTLMGWGGGQMLTEQKIKERKRCWIGHTLCKPQGAIE
jgi:hypothetical protein